MARQKHGATIKVYPGKGFKTTINRLTLLGRGYERLPTMVLPRMSKLAEDMVRKRLPSRSSESGIGAGHSTPIPIDRFLHRQKLSNTSYKVFFDKYPVIPHIGKADDLIKIIEEGARPHDIPVPQIRGKGIDFGLTPMRIFKHPGMEGFHMWKRGMTEFEHSYKALLEERYSHMKRQHWQAPANFNPSFRPANWG